MNLQEHMEYEFELLKQQDDKPIILAFEKPMKDIIEIFSKQDHSGVSANFYSNIIVNCIKQLLQFETLSPLTGEENEWSEIGNEDSVTIYQNKRNSAVFKQEKIVNYLNGIIWQNIDNEYDSFTGSVENISSNVKGLHFPLTPKTFRINVKKVPGICPVSESYFEEESESRNVVYHYEIVNKDDLKEVEKYYKLYLGDPDGDALDLGKFEPEIREYIKKIRESFHDYNSFINFVNDVGIVSKQIENLGGKLRSRQILALISSSHLKNDLNK